jgi:hypothetical protein
MKPKKLKNHVKKAKAGLAWTVVDVTEEVEQVRIFSDPQTRTHTVYLPPAAAAESAGSDLFYLHELGHALLCERVHPFFAGDFPIAGLTKELVPAVGPVLSAASDWFVGHWLLEFCPGPALAELEGEYQATAALMASGRTPGLDGFFTAVLVIARSIRYLDRKVECDGFLDAAVRAFLAVSPADPSAARLLELINSLLALGGAPYRCRQTGSRGQDVMEFFRAETV